MQTFQDTETGQFWQFDDDVIVLGDDGAREFWAAHGERLNAPASLVPAEMPPPAEPEQFVPQVVSRFQGREAMHQTPYGDGTLFDAADAIIADPQTPAMYRRAWDDLQEFRRDSEMLAAVAVMLDLSQTQIDALFILAASIKA